MPMGIDDFLDELLNVRHFGEQQVVVGGDDVLAKLGEAELGAIDLIVGVLVGFFL